MEGSVICGGCGKPATVNAMFMLEVSYLVIYCMPCGKWLTYSPGVVT